MLDLDSLEAAQLHVVGTEVAVAGKPQIVVGPDQTHRGPAVLVTVGRFTSRSARPT